MKVMIMVRLLGGLFGHLVALIEHTKGVGIF
jgi:hypothetical protein